MTGAAPELDVAGVTPEPDVAGVLGWAAADGWEPVECAEPDGALEELDGPPEEPCEPPDPTEPTWEDTTETAL